MAKSYLASTARAFRSGIIAGVGPASGFPNPYDEITLGAMIQRQGQTQGALDINIVTQHVGHESEALTDGRVNHTHTWECEIYCRDAREAMLAADAIYEALYGRIDTYDGDASYYFFPESTGIRYEDQNYYIASVLCRIDITED